MMWDRRLYLQDAIGVRDASVSKTRVNLVKKAEAFVNWSYSATEKCCRKGPGGLLSVEQVRSSIDQIKLDVSRENNTDALNLLYPYFAEIPGNFYPVDKERYQIGVNTSVQNRLFGLIHQGNSGCLYWNQYRKSGALDELELSITATVLREVYLEDPDYSDFSLKLLDIGANDEGNRCLRVYDAAELDVIHQSQLDEFFQPVFQAINELRTEKYVPKKPAIKTPKTPFIDPDAPGFFD